MNLRYQVGIKAVKEVPVPRSDSVHEARDARLVWDFKPQNPNISVLGDFQSRHPIRTFIMRCELSFAYLIFSFVIHRESPFAYVSYPWRISVRYEEVPSRHWPPVFLPRGRQRRRFSRCGAVEIQHTVFQILFQQAGKRRFQRLPPPA